MQRVIILVLVLLLGFISCNKTGEEQNFQIDVEIADIPNGRKAILKKRVDRITINIDTTVINDGKFSFKGHIKEPIIFGIFIDSLKRGGIFPFVGVNDTIKVVAYKDSLNKSKIAGSKLHNELTRLRENRDELYKKTQAKIPEYKIAAESKDTITLNRIKKENKVIGDKMAMNDWNYVKNNTESYLAPLVLNGIMANPKFKDSIKIVFNNFSGKIKDSDLSRPIRMYFEMLEKNEKELEMSKPTTSKPSEKGKIKMH